MLVFRRSVVLLSTITFFIVILLLGQYSAFQSTRERLLSASQGVAEKFGLGDLNWPSIHDTSADQEQASVSNHDTPQIFEFGKGKPAGYNFTRALVMPRTKEEDVGWIYKELHDIKKVVYVADNQSALLHPPANKGHEVMVYLTYIIDNYETLPDIMIFMHAHRWAWHNSDVLGYDAKEMVNRLNPHRVAREGYMNLRCNWYPGCPEWIHPGETENDPFKSEQVLIAQAWAELFPFQPLPKMLAQPCCSQFALSRDLVQTIPKANFQAWRKWLLTTRLRDSMSGRVWEYIWQYAFTGKSSLCPVEHMCYCDGYGVCFGGKAEFDAFYVVRNERNKYRAQLLDWEKAASKIKDAIEAGKSTDGLDEPIHGQDMILNVKIQALDDELKKRLSDALYRGADPKRRAEELGKEWHEGDSI